MLESYRKAYEEAAAIIPGWKEMDKNALVNRYVEVEKDARLANAYMSAILCRYWGVLNKFYVKSYRSVSDPTIYHEWLVDAVAWAVKHRKWLDPTNKLYKDPNGPDKVINRVLASERLIWFQHSNALKRKGNFNLNSIEDLQEVSSSHLEDKVISPERLTEHLSIKMLVDKALKSADYVTAYVVSGIINHDVFERSKEDQTKPCALHFSEKKLLRYLHNLSEGSIDEFAYYFGRTHDEAAQAAAEISKLSLCRLKKQVKRSLDKLREEYTREREEVAS